MLSALFALHALPAIAGGGTSARSVKGDLRADDRFAEPLPDPAQAAEGAGAAALAEGVDAYVAFAVATHPDVRAAFEGWAASVHRIARARTLPEPTLQLGVFVQSIETRVGPQQARISISQAFPWPTRLTAGADAASAEALAAQQRVEAASLAVAQRVEEAYWSLWEIRATRALHRDHLEILGGLSSTVRSRVEVGAATLADLQQVDLSRARLEDRIRSLDEAERSAEATLRAAIGVQAPLEVPTPGEPAPFAAGETREALVSAVATHPLQQSAAWRVEAAEAQARSLGAQRLPSVTLGADWIVTGPAVMPDTPGSGKDAVMAGVGVKVPLWQGTYGHEVEAARAEARAREADQRGRLDQSVAQLDLALAAVRDSGRRIGVVSDTLLPQADAAYTSVLGNYTAGRSAVAQTLLSQRDLLDLRVELARARADHQRAWARLDQLCGREVARTTEPSE